MFVYSFWCKPAYSEYGAMYTIVAESIPDAVEVLKAHDEYEFKQEFSHNIEYLLQCIAKGAIIKCEDFEDPRVAEYFTT
jgi:hypothetical protein